MMNRWIARWALTVTCLSLSACGGGGGGIGGTGGTGGGGGIGGTGSPLGTGNVRFAVTDAPSCGYDQVNVTIDRVRFNQDAGAGDSGSGWYEVALPAPQKVNLLSLTNGTLLELGQSTVPVGHYTQLRLVLAANGGSTPLANSVVPTGGAETALTTPSAQQSGLKVDATFDVSDSTLTDLVLDFDACKSVVKAGNSGKYNLKPVITLLPRVTTIGNRVTGVVSPLLTAAGATVSLQTGGTPVKATSPDATGAFALTPVPTGTYDLVITAPGRATQVIRSVPVTAAAATPLGTAALPLPAPATVVATRVVTGTLSNPAGTVRATQALSGGGAVEVAWGSVDATSGAFTMTLPQASPLVATYAPGATPVFAADTAIGGRYTIDAAVGATHVTQPVDTAAPVPALVITLPSSTQ